MSASNQQTLAEFGALDRPPMLEKESCVPWESRFKRILDNKQEDGERMWRLIEVGPYVRQEIQNPDKPDDLKSTPNDIYNLVDGCKDAKTMWERIERLMRGSDKTEQVRHSRLVDEFDKFVEMEGESLTSMYERLTTRVNFMDRNNVCPIPIFINTKFFNSLQPEWSKYVTMTCQSQNLHNNDLDHFYDALSQYDPHVNASKAKRAARNHDPLAPLAQSNTHPLYSQVSSSYSNKPQPYYVTHPSSVLDHEEDYQGELQGNAQEYKLTTTMMLLARAITQKFSTTTSNHLRTSSNPMNQAVIQDVLAVNLVKCWSFNIIEPCISYGN
nr:hypothetical protein [Tanacetum cinerariifolium]